MQICFDLYSPYYWPQYEPVYNELVAQGHECYILAYKSNQHEAPETDFFNDLAQSLPVDFIEEKSALSYYQQKQPDWIIFGNGSFSNTKDLNINTKTALLYHGIGVKACYYSPSLARYDIRFTEGHFRQLQLKRMYPKTNFVEVGFAKLDPLFNNKFSDKIDLDSLGLDSSKKTLLYAPTFYPSSIERMPRNWPSTLSDFNIIIKPHFFSLNHSKYKKQRQLFDRWANFKNVYLVPSSNISLLPYMEVADLLISEASSALFEFAALDKPIIWLDFLKLRWSYCGPFKYRYLKRMDATINEYNNIAQHVASPRQLEEEVRHQISSPSQFTRQRHAATSELIGQTDGNVSSRIVKALEEYKRKPTS